MGEKRAKYGSKVIKTLSENLQKEFGKGFSEDTLKNARKFYLTYKERISETVFSLFAIEKSETVFSFFEKEPPFIVSWSHYLQLMRIENEAERSFYEIETAKTGWGVRTLQRQYNSSLYERLALSRDRVFSVYLLLPVLNLLNLFFLLTYEIHKLHNTFDVIIHKQQIFVL